MKIVALLILLLTSTSLLATNTTQLFGVKLGDDFTNVIKQFSKNNITFKEEKFRFMGIKYQSTNLHSDKENIDYTLGLDKEKLTNKINAIQVTLLHKRDKNNVLTVFNWLENVFGTFSVGPYNNISISNNLPLDGWKVCWGECYINTFIYADDLFYKIKTKGNTIFKAEIDQNFGDSTHWRTQITLMKIN